MDIDLPDAFVRYASRGILMDTNILLMFVVGRADRRQIPKFKRTAKFKPEHFDLLSAFLSHFHRKVTTPSILAEVSNFAGQLNEPLRKQCFHRLSREIQLLHEHYDPSTTIAEDDLFLDVGLTDCAIRLAARDQYLVLTDDLELASRLNHLGVTAVNFNHLIPLPRRSE